MPSGNMRHRGKYEYANERWEVEDEAKTEDQLSIFIRKVWKRIRENAK